MTFDPSRIKFGRKPQVHDHRDFRLGDFITPTILRRAALTTSREWQMARVLDQGDSNHCVGYAWAHMGISLPVYQDWYADTGRAIYYAAKIIDGQPGQENGTYTRSGVQAFMQFAKLKDSTYAFATSLQDIITWVLAVGPVITGTSWYEAMYWVDQNGRISVGGAYQGGHEWTISGVDTDKQLFKCTNSWGTQWGVNGQFYISFSDYQILLDNYGDACTATEVSAQPVPVQDSLKIRVAIT